MNQDLDHPYELGEQLNAAVRRRGIPIGDTTLEYAYRKGTAVQGRRRIYLRARKYGRVVLVTLRDVEEWALAVARAQATSAPAPETDEPEQSKPRRQSRMSMSSAEQARRAAAELDEAGF